MMREERLLLAAVSRHLRERFPYQPQPFHLDELTRASFDADGITVKRRARGDCGWQEWGTRYPFRTVIEGVDLAVALGLLPVEFSAAYRQGLEDAHSEISDGADPAYLLNVAEHGRDSGDPYLYLECGECDDMAVRLEVGDGLPDILANARRHHDLYHADEIGDGS